MNELIFIYNAKSGVLNAFLDWSHKMFSPNTYECNLCGITYNSFGKVSKWKTFLDSKKLKKTFYYTDHISSLDFMTEVTFPVLPLSLPLITITLSPVLILNFLFITRPPEQVTLFS